MRCPKCGFISFDFQEKCSKCKKSLKSVSKTLVGTVHNVAPPSFLKFSGEEAGQEQEPVVFEADEAAAVAAVAAAEPELNLQSEDQYDEVDLAVEDSGDDDLFVGVDEVEPEEDEFILEVPEELNDISDLAPPAMEVEEVDDKQPIEEEEVSLDFDLSGDDFADLDGSAEDDLGFTPEDTDDLSDLLGNGSGDSAMERENPDGDVDFDLDLSDLTLDEK